ncbi:hypothetical protein [Brevundimonas sp.]|uniref:hypothetical protein n=1 Tax=Brevundimonas sp. TaxID=1871086 RepID=UPI003F70FB14
MMEFLAAALLATAQVPPSAQDPAPTQLEDVVVSGRELDQLISRFVDQVAAPNRGRGLARWNQRICVGVANLRPEVAQYLVDRISTVAEDVGLEPGAPGCRPNILVVATADDEAAAREMVEDSTRVFRMGGTGMDRGRLALAGFQQTNRPVRWWQVSMPVDSQTGARAVRLPGDCEMPACAQAEFNFAAYAPVISISSASRLNTEIVDNLIHTIVIVDVDEVSGLSALQLADYIAMVSLAQIDPDADTGTYASILNVFEEPETVDTLTGWDRAYLQGLYQSEQDDRIRSSARRQLELSIRRAHARAGQATEE